jgi:hypothetical protein
VTISAVWLWVIIACILFWLGVICLVTHLV